MTSRSLPSWAVVAVAGAGGVLGSYAFVLPWLLAPAVAAAAVVAWWAAPGSSAFGVWLVTFLVTVGNAGSADGNPRRLLAAGAFALLTAVAVVAARTVVSTGTRYSSVVAPAVAAVGVLVAVVLPGPSVPVSGGPAGDGLDADTTERIDEFVLDAMAARRAPGVAVAVVQGRDVVLERGYGVAGTERREVTPESTFLMASVSKSFTSLATMQLVEAGFVGLDAPVQEYLPWFRVGGDGAPITVRQLLNQTSGFSTAQGWGILERATPRSLEDDVRDLRDVEPEGAPGERFRYSNLNAMVLGMVVQEVSGEPYADYLEDHVLEPLGMDSTQARPGTGAEMGLAEGYRLWFGVPIAHGTTRAESAIPLGGISSSVADMSRYLRMYLGDGAFDGATVLSPGGIATMLAPAAAPADAGEFADGPPRSAYAMGWHWSEDEDGAVRLAHTGTASEYSAGVVIVPDRGWGVVALANEQDALAQIGPFVADGVTDVLVGDDPPSPRSSVLGSYLVANLATVAVAAGLVHAVGALRGWRARLTRRRAWRVVLWALLMNLVVPLVIWRLPTRVEATWPFLWTYAPGFVLALLVAAFVLAALGAAKVVLAARRPATGDGVNGRLRSPAIDSTTESA